MITANDARIIRDVSKEKTKDAAREVVDKLIPYLEEVIKDGAAEGFDHVCLSCRTNTHWNPLRDPVNREVFFEYMWRHGYCVETAHVYEFETIIRIQW